MIGVTSWQLAQQTPTPAGLFYCLAMDIALKTNAGLFAMEFRAAAQEMRATATMRALNKVAAQGKVAAARLVRDTGGYKIKIGRVKAAIRVERATAGNLRAALIAKGRPIPLVEFAARQTSKGVTVAVKDGRKLIPGAFLATMPGGHQGVFVHDERKAQKHRKVNNTRGGWHQLPIRELYGPSVVDGMANAAVQSALEQVLRDKFPDILEHEHSWLARRVKGRGR